MVRLYSGSGSKEVQVLDKVLRDEAWAVLRGNVIRLLNARRGGQQTAELLGRVPFELREGTNGFNDEFCVLYYRAPLDRYVELAESFERDQLEREYRRLAEAVTEAGHYIRFMVLDLDPESGPAPVATPSLEIRSDTVERALADVEQLIHSRGAASGVDRVHTAFHGYLKAVAVKASIQIHEDANVTTLFKTLREKHTALIVPEPRAADLDRILRSIATILDTLNPIRNRATIAHPNEVILSEPEAMLVINSVRTLLYYLDAKLRQ
jgi:hypothetical protein